MLKIISGVGNNPDVITASGTTTDIVVELGQAIAAIHSQLRRSSPEDAKLFQSAVKYLVSGPGTPLWSTDVQATFGMAMSVPKKEDSDG